MRIKNGTTYFEVYEDARRQADALRPTYPEVRIVDYALGFAVQFHQSGAYWAPDAPTHAPCHWCPRRDPRIWEHEHGAAGVAYDDARQ